jgi:hypothetical protein
MQNTRALCAVRGPVDRVLDRSLQLSAFALAMGMLASPGAGGLFAAPAPATTSPPADDIVETIQRPAEKSQTPGVRNPGATTESNAAVSSPHDTADSYSVSAWALQELHLMLGASPTDPPYLSVPFDRAISRSHALVHFRYERERWFEVDISGAFSYGYFVRGLGGSLQTDVSDYSTRGSFEPSLRELYFAFFMKTVDLRLGMQRVAWGRADAQSPNDVLNARDLRDPFQAEPDLVQIPTPLVRADWSLGATTLEGIWAPFFVPDVFDIYGSNWAFVQPDSPAGIRGFFRTMSELVDPSLVDRFNRLIQQTQIPFPTAINMSAGAKISRTIGDFDFDLYYHFGFDRTPLVRIDPAFQDTLNRLDFSRVQASDFGPFFSSIQAGFPPLTSEYVQRHHVGADSATTLGPIGVRVDVGYDSQRVFFRPDFTGAMSPALQGVLSLEYQTADVRKVVLLEGSVLHLLEDPGLLLFVERTTITGTGLVRYPILRSLDVELRAVASALPSSLVLRPQVGWRVSDHLTIHVGALWLAGEQWSLGEYFGRNTEVYSDAKYAL